MAISNVLLYNAALNGYLAGALAGAPQSDPTSLDYKPIVDQAVVFATAMDAAIAMDNVGAPQPAGTTAISVAGGGGVGVAITPAAGSALIEAQAVKPQLMQALCFGAAFQRFTTGLSAGNYTTLIAAIKAVYFQTLLSASYAA